MAIIEFDNSYDLINYLCQEDVLGKLKVSYNQERSLMLEPSFNFDYPALHQHLYGIFWDWPSFFGYNSRVFISFDNAEDYDVSAEDDMQWSEYDLSKDIYEFVQDLIFQKFGVESYLLISIEGTGFTLEEISVEKL